MWNQSGHAILDAAGFIPYLGIVADIVNAVWYFAEGKTFEGVASIISAIPGLGDVVGKGLKVAGKAAKGFCMANKLSRAGDLVKLGTHMAGNAGSLALSGAIIWDNATNIGNYLAGNEYEGNVWDSVSAIGFALVATVLGAKGLEDSSKAFNALKNKPAGIGNKAIGQSLDPYAIMKQKGIPQTLTDAEISVSNKYNMQMNAYQENSISRQVTGTSYDINKLIKTQSYVDYSIVSGMKDSIVKKGANAVPPISVRVHHGEALVVQGHHRLEAFFQLGYERVPINYVHKSQLGKHQLDGDYFRNIEELLAGRIYN